MTENVNDFRYVNLSEVDPNFELLAEEVYDLRISKAEFRTYAAKTANAAKGVQIGDEGTYINFTFTVQNHPKFSGRKHFESLFPSNFTFKVLRRIADATGIQQEQGESMEVWLAKLSSTQPTVRLKVDVVPDGRNTKNPVTGQYEFVANPRTANPDGTPSKKNAVDWKSGVQPGTN